MGQILSAAVALFFYPVLLVSLVLWIYSVYDAYTVAREYNRYLLEHDGQPPW